MNLDLISFFAGAGTIIVGVLLGILLFIISARK